MAINGLLGSSNGQKGSVASLSKALHVGGQKSAKCEDRPQFAYIRHSLRNILAAVAPSIGTERTLFQEPGLAKLHSATKTSPVLGAGEAGWSWKWPPKAPLLQPGNSWTILPRLPPRCVSQPRLQN